MARREGEVICVTGGSGFIGSWIVRLLLRRGYNVRATIDLLDYDSIAAAVSGSAGVFHLASPCVIDQVQDPQRELLDPAIKGTINVLTAAKHLGVRRVVITSSISAMIASSNSPAGVGEDCWIDEDYCRQNGLWYPLSKVLAEKAAWKFAEENGLDIVVVNPGMVAGPIIPPALNSSMQLMLRVLQGGNDFAEGFFMALVHVKDVALAHLLLYENTSTSGRHLCVESLSCYADFVKTMEKLYPEYKLPRPCIDTQHGSLKSDAALKKLIDLGMEFIPLEQIVKDSIESFRNRGYIS